MRERMCHLHVIWPMRTSEASVQAGCIWAVPCSPKRGANWATSSKLRSSNGAFRAIRTSPSSLWLHRRYEQCSRDATTLVLRTYGRTTPTYHDDLHISRRLLPSNAPACTSLCKKGRARRWWRPRGGNQTILVWHDLIPDRGKRSLCRKQ